MMKRKRPMPVGIEDFQELIEKNYYFVDKTRFIRELLDDKGKVLLITRPRRFGKTLNLSMLRYFFTQENVEENRALFAGLDIERAGEEYMREQGTRPVVFLTLKSVNRPTYASMLKMISSMLQELYENYRYFLVDHLLTAPQKEYMERIISAKSTEEDMILALKRLAVYLEKHHGRKPVLLLDEYDAPILSAWEHGYYGECIDFMRGFLGEALKSNDALDFAVLTGVTRVSKESIFSGLNNLEVCSVLSDLYSDAFGFTQEEVARLMTECGVADKLPDLKRWYDGYRFGSAEIYNPWSVIQFIRNGCKFRPYWLNTSENSILNVLLQHVDARRQEELENLLKGKPVKAPVMENIIYADVHADRDTLFMMLLTSGYLKAVNTWQDESYREWVNLQIPNREICRAFEDEILKNMVPRQGAVILRDMLDAMAGGNTEDFAKNLSELLLDFVSFHDSAHNPESFYHGLILGFSILLESTYRVESNRESGYGRFDIAFFPKKEGAPGVILELKAAKSDDELKILAGNALQQIEEKAYVTELSRQGVKDVWKYGIAFHGKRVWMERG